MGDKHLVSNRNGENFKLALEIVSKVTLFVYFVWVLYKPDVGRSYEWLEQRDWKGEVSIKLEFFSKWILLENEKRTPKFSNLLNVWPFCNFFFFWLVLKHRIPRSSHEFLQQLSLCIERQLKVARVRCILKGRTHRRKTGKFSGFRHLCRHR